ncbi:hypothetical protein E0Z10_g7158 [Xylaria hypoxylon]|uniref:Uncharacterized protein n=1 Tax=Xylaria hypoxylon TaxID=37992 RepID=A0A4Z0YCE5_9PEZI|nr:hypothetical protein E0Z10_g7158 [Xylaria hypoxylon]
MGAQQSKEAHQELGLETAHSGVLENDDDEELFTFTQLYKWESIDIVWWKFLKTHGNQPQKYGQPASPPKGRKRPQPANTKHQVNSGKTKLQTQSSHLVKKSKKTTHSTRKRSHRKRPRADDKEHRVDVCKADLQTENLHTATNSGIIPSQDAPGLSSTPHNQTSHPKDDTREQIFDTQSSKHQTIGANISNGSEFAPYSVTHYVPIHSSSELAGSRARQGKNITARIEGIKEHGLDGQKQPKRSHTAKKNKLAPFRRAKRNLSVHLDTVSESDKLEESQQDKYVVSRVDAGAILNDARPPTISEPRAQKPLQDRFHVSSDDRDANRLPNQPSTPNDRQIDNPFHKLGQPLPPRTSSEQPEIALIQQLESRKPPPEYVTPKYKWEYIIKYVDSADIILDDEDKEEKAMTDRSFADREKANEYLDKKTSPEAVGGLEAIASRTTTLEGPERLLKVNIELSNGEHHLMWVERGMVVLSNLKSKQRQQMQWKPTPRPKFPHYVVTCDLITYETSVVTRCEEEDDEGASLAEQGIGLGSLGCEIKLRIEKLSPKAFTFREIANEHAGKLFLEMTKVDRRFANSSDTFWWECNAVPDHKKAMAGARKPDGLYEIAMEVYDMNSRLGWDQIVVHVHKVDDVTGPVNF